jgi:hypothetical protein
MIKIASIQTNIVWENPKANKLEYDKIFQSIEACRLNSFTRDVYHWVFNED